VKSIWKAGVVLATAMVLTGAAFAVVAAPPAGKGKREKADFVRGKSNTRAARVTPPKNEREALATRRVTASGIVEMQLPEDRMVNLVAVRRADGSVALVHQGENDTHRHAAPQGDVE
jgi:hypothetical protein